MTAPDTAAILCPLCGYDLRSLPEPRCPECGARFDSFDELTDPARKNHPFLFEHSSHRNVRSFTRTLLAGMRPIRFWRSVHPRLPVRVHRLSVYWLICCAFFLSAWAARYACDLIELRTSLLADRRSETTRFHGTAMTFDPMKPANTWNEVWRRLVIRFDLKQRNQEWRLADDQEVADLRKQFRTLEAMLDQNYPLPPSLRFFYRATDRYRPLYSSVEYQKSGLLLFAGAMLMLIVPLTLGALMIFRASMQRSGVRFIHLMRVAIYCGDALVWPSLGIALLLVPLAITDVRHTSPLFGMDNLLELPMWLLLTLLLAGWLLMTARLAVAIKIYLQFKHATAVAISVQVIVCLALAQLYVILGVLSR